MSGNQTRSAAQTFAWPLALALLTVAALIAGVLADGAADVAAVLGLFAPAALGAWKLIRALAPPSQRSV